ncbi:MAG: hypothetical protein C0606_07415 [Hyphomicrobiales bacterium]|nr:MAG: hypothetical protein C0606_07415 [Hyphomicrobiales bacterium]
MRISRTICRLPLSALAVRSALVAAVAVTIGLADGVTAPVPAEAKVITVPEGNRSKEQPKVPGFSVQRTRATKSSFEAKYKRVYSALERDSRLIGKIKRVAKIYDIDPVHMIGAIVGEHTYNVDSMDHLQTYYIKALEYAGSALVFSYDGVRVTEFVEQEAFDKCKKAKGSNALWTCREAVWETVYRGRVVDGVRYENTRFGQAFFQPMFAGQTFGLGQLNPLTALKMNDMVADKGGLARLDPANAPYVYRAIMDPDTSLHYMAAVIRSSIDAYRETAGFDIANNPGITATLYNVGNAEIRARQLRAINRKRQRARRKLLWPVENYYGWLVNDKIEELRKLL